MSRYAQTGKSIGKSVGAFLQAMEAEKKRGRQKESTLSFLDDLAGMFGNESVDSPEQLLIPSEDDASPEGDMFNELMGFMSGGSLGSDEGAVPGTIEMAPGQVISPNQERNQQINELIGLYRSAYGQEENVDPGALGLLQGIGNMISPKKGRGRSLDEQKELETLKGDIRQEKSEQLYDLKSEFQIEKHKQQMELQQKKNDYAIQKMNQAGEDRVRSLTLKSEGADILNQVNKGDKEPQAALSQIDAAIRELDSDIASRRQELNEFQIDHPEAAKATRSAITDLEKSRRELSGYQRRIMDKAGRTPSYDNKQKEKETLLNDLERARKIAKTGTGQRKAKAERAVKAIERKIQALE